jgi:hypothetical protein
LATVDYQGTVTLTLSVRNFKSTCAFDLTRFPFDQTSCSIHLASRTVRPDILNMTRTTRTSQPNQPQDTMWTLRNQSMSSIRPETANSGGSLKEVLSVNLILKRRSFYFFLSLLLPLLILNTLTILSFGLPTVAQFGLCVTVLLIYAVQTIRIELDRPVRLHHSMTVLSVYIMCSQLITLTAFVWFVIEHVLRSTARIPRFLVLFAGLLRHRIRFMPGRPPKVEHDDLDLTKQLDNEIRVALYFLKILINCFFLNNYNF